MADFGKLNFAVSFNPQTAFPLDARYYFSSLSAAEAAAATAVEVGSSDGTYFYGENVCVVTESSADLYIIQPDKTLKAVGSAVLGDGKSIEIIKLAGAALNISEKAVNIPFAGDTAGVVTSSTGENKVAVAEDGSMEVNSLNMNKLVQSDGDTLILDGGNAAV